MWRGKTAALWYCGREKKNAIALVLASSYLCPFPDSGRERESNEANDGIPDANFVSLGGGGGLHSNQFYVCANIVKTNFGICLSIITLHNLLFHINMPAALACCKGKE